MKPEAKPKVLPMPPAAATKRFTYSTLHRLASVTWSDWHARLNELGAAGWALIAVDGGVAYMAREVAA